MKRDSTWVYNFQRKDTLINTLIKIKFIIINTFFYFACACNFVYNFDFYLLTVFQICVLTHAQYTFYSNAE